MHPSGWKATTGPPSCDADFGRSYPCRISVPNKTNQGAPLAAAYQGSIGATVRHLRQERGWSRLRLAAEADLSPQTISNVENEWTYPQWNTVYNLASALNVSAFLLRGVIKEEPEDLSVDLTRLEQQKLGAHWVEDEGRFVIDPAGTDSDIAAALDPVTVQLHVPVIEKAGLFSDTSKRLDNAIGWHGIAGASERFLKGVNRPTGEIPANLGSVYSAILELGSFLEQDIRLQASTSSSASPLDPEVHRVLSDLIRTAAPWLRRFPTIRELDDEAGAFLTRKDLLDPGAALITIARDRELVSGTDADVIGGLLEAARRGELQGQKASTRSVASTGIWFSLVLVTLPCFCRAQFRRTSPENHS
jgi:transcriptional regulator with XRE-family HTH domain